MENSQSLFDLKHAITVADLHSKILDARPTPRGPNSFNFMQFLLKFGKIVCWHPTGELAPPPRGNPGSATELHVAILVRMTLSTKIELIQLLVNG